MHIKQEDKMTVKNVLRMKNERWEKKTEEGVLEVDYWEYGLSYGVRKRHIQMQLSRRANSMQVACR